MGDNKGDLFSVGLSLRRQDREAVPAQQETGKVRFEVKAARFENKNLGAAASWTAIQTCVWLATAHMERINHAWSKSKYGTRFPLIGQEVSM